MEPNARILLARHGHSTANRPWTFLGRTDAPLSSEGEAQARALAGRLAPEKVDALYTSPLRRARQTADILADPHRLTLRVDDRLIEQDFGEWEGLTLDEAMERFPKDAAAWRADAEGAAPTGGESLLQLAVRAQNMASVLRRDNQEATVLVVAHGGILNALVCTFLHTPMSWLWAYRLEVGAVSELLLYGGRATLVRLNDA